MQLGKVAYAGIFFALCIFCMVTFYGEMISTYTSENTTGAFHATSKINASNYTARYSNISNSVNIMYGKAGGGKNETTGEPGGLLKVIQIIPGYQTASQIFNGLQVAKSFLIMMFDSFGIGIEIITQSMQLINFPIPPVVIALITLGLGLAILYAIASIVLQWRTG